MKQLILISILSFTMISFAHAMDYVDGSGYSELLAKHVSMGVVDYKALERERVPLDRYRRELSQVSKAGFSTWPEQQQLAYLINVYNANTLILILDNYPVESIKDIGGIFKGPWSLKVVSLFGEKVTLDYVEHELLRKKFNEPRIHFALVCAAKGCPPLRAEAYTAENLEQQLEEQGQIFLAQNEKNRIDIEENILHLSPIFKWFREDFKTPSESLVDFIKPYFKEEKLDDAWEIKFTKYDWSLNE